MLAGTLVSLALEELLAEEISQCQAGKIGQEEFNLFILIERDVSDMVTTFLEIVYFLFQEAGTNFVDGNHSVELNSSRKSESVY